MDSTAALVAGLVAGLAIAMQVGAVSVLLIEAAVVEGPRRAMAAGMGVATADLAFAVVAVAVGGAAGAVLAGHQDEIRLFAAAVLAAIAVHGLVALRRSRDEVSAESTPHRSATARVHYARFLAITIANPLTIASFSAVAASLSLVGLAAGAAFVAGVGVASAVWHLALTLLAAHAGRWVTPRIRRGLAIGGRLVVLVIAVNLAVAI